MKGQPGSEHSTALERSPRVVSIVLNWNGAGLTRTCVEHLVAQTAPLHIIVIDNGSKDGSVDKLSDLVTPACELIALPTNLGFAGGCNLGVQRAVELGADYVWLVNNDAFVEKDCLSLLLDFMDRTADVALTTPRLMSPDGSEQHAGGTLNWYSGDAQPATSEAMAGAAPKGRWITGTAPLVRLSALTHEPPFNGDFFAYWEDVDLSLQLAARGHDLRALPSAVAHHMERASTGGGHSPTFLYLMARNQWLLQSKYLPVRARPGALLRFTARFLESYAGYAQRGDHASANAVLGAINAAWTGEVGPPPAQWRTLPLSMVTRHPWRAASIFRAGERALDFLLRSPVKSDTSPVRHA